MYTFVHSNWNFFSIQNPALNFKEVTYELDHPGFQIRDSKGLHNVVYGIQRGLGMDVFPVDLIYRPWKNAEGQVNEWCLAIEREQTNDLFLFFNLMIF